MAQVDGIVSGLDTTSIIDSLIAITLQPVIGYEDRIEEHELQVTTLTELSALGLTAQLNAFALTKKSAFDATDTVSSNDSILSATGTATGVTGTFDFQVAREATTSQLIGPGVADESTTTLPAGVINVEMGGGFIDHETKIDDLNAGQGIDRGSIQVTDGLNNTSTIDLKTAVSVQDVVNLINADNDILVSASISGDGLILTDLSGGGAVSVAEVSGGSTAKDLGLDVIHVAGVMTGRDINYVDGNTNINFLNDGRGIDTVDIAGGADDIIFTLSDLSTVSVDLTGSQTIQDILDAINTAGGGNLTASFDTNAKAFRFVDNAGGLGNLTVADDTDPVTGAASGTVKSLGLAGISAEDPIDGTTTSGNPLTVLNGLRVVGRIDSKLTTTLNGGSGVTDGSITITDRQGSSATLDLSKRVETDVAVALVPAGATSFDVTSTAGFAVGNTLRITDGTNTEHRVITSIAGTTISFSDPLSNGYALGSGVYAENQSVGDILNIISNESTINVTARYNDELNGLKIEDDNTASPTTDLSIVESGSTTAAEYGILSGTPLGHAVTVGGSTTSLDSATLVGLHPDDYFNGMEAVITGGVNAGQQATIIDYDATTGVITFDTAFGAAFGAGDTFTITGVQQDEFNGFDLNAQYISRNTKLSDLNQGDGVHLGTFQVNDGTNIFTVDLSGLTEPTVGDLIDDFHLASIGPGTRLTINSGGNGLLVTSGGAGPLTITDLSGGTTAYDLNIVGDTTGTTIDGSFQYSVTLDGTQTLDDLRDELNSLNLDMSVTTINDGSGTNPYHINIVSNVSGDLGRLGVDYYDDYNNPVGFKTTTKAQNAALLFGNTNPVMVESNDNSITDLIPGLTLNIKQASTETVTITITRNIDEIINSTVEFVDSFNEMIEKIDEVTKYNIDTDGGDILDEESSDGVLAGNAALRNVRSMMFRDFNSILSGVASPFNRFSGVGLSVKSDGLGIELDEDEFRSHLENNFDEVEELFRLGAIISNSTDVSTLRGQQGIRTFDGANDLTITLSDGTAFDVNLDGVDTILGVINAINLHPSNTGNVTASLRSDGEGLKVVDSSGGAGSFSITNFNLSRAATDLGISQQGITNSAGDLEIKGFSIRDGKMDELNQTLTQIVESDGILDGQTDTINSQISELEDQIERLEEQALSERARLEREFAELESVLNELSVQSTFIESQLGNLNVSN